MKLETKILWCEFLMLSNPLYLLLLIYRKLKSKVKVGGK
jgi:hypothetical protein